MAEHTKVPSNQSVEIPFPLSWIDRLIVWIDHLPGSVWLFYVLGAMAMAFIVNAMFWLDGSIPVGSVDTITTFFGIFVFYWVALYQYLTRVGSKSLQAFLPLLDTDEFEVAQVGHELGTLPRWLGWLAIPLGLVLGAGTILGDPAPFGDIVPRTPIPYVLDIALTSFLWATFFCVVIRSILQLRTVRRLHARATNVNLLKLEPAHAFSTLTARTGIGVILLLVFAYLLDPSAAIGTTLDIFLYVVTVTISIAVFVVPVIGMRDHLEDEKERLLNETSDLLQSASDDLHSKVNRRAYDDFSGIEDSISALIRERELIAKISTWPWDLRTVRAFSSAMLLPIFLWLVTRLLERFF